MKKEREIAVKAILASLLLTVGLLFINCSNGTTNSDSRKEYHIPETTIPIWREVGVSETDMNKILGYISNIYQIPIWTSTGFKGQFEAKITEIRVYPDGRKTKNGTIMEIGSNNTYNDVKKFMGDIADGTITKSKSANAIRLVDNYNSAKKRAYISI